MTSVQIYVASIREGVCNVLALCFIVPPVSLGVPRLAAVRLQLRSDCCAVPCTITWWTYVEKNIHRFYPENVWTPPTPPHMSHVFTFPVEYASVLFPVNLP